MAFKDAIIKNTNTGNIGGIQRALQQQGKTSLAGTAAKADTKTSSGLYSLATQSGFQKQADSILNRKGEETKKIFSGGFISDVFDALNALQYGVVGMLKGKGFMEGVKTRQSWSDRDALGNYGLPGVIGGIALDIASDPLTYIAPWTIIKKIKPLMKAGKAVKGAMFGKAVERTIETAEGLKKVSQLEGGTKLGKYLSEKFIWMSGADPVFKETWERGIKNTAVGVDNVSKIARGLVDLPKETARKLLTKDSTGRYIRKGLDVLKNELSPEEFNKVSAAWLKIDDLGKQATELGMLSRGKFEENFGEYIRNAYKEFEDSKTLFKRAKVGIKGIKARVQGLTPEKMAELGQIDNPAYLFFKGSLDLTKDIENAKLFREVSSKFGSDVIQSGFKQLPKSARLGDLAGKWVPEQMEKYIQEIAEPANYGLGRKLIGEFKVNKVLLNPSTHARNLMSNQILNWWKLGMNPLDPRVVKTNSIALREISKGGGKWAKEAKQFGYGLDTMAANELRGILDGPDAINIGKKLGGAWKEVKNKLGDLYQGEENFAKLSAYIFNRTSKGMDGAAAWKAAEAATFNYAQVTPFVRKLRTSIWGYPFITFALKSAPVVAETAVKAPRRISAFGKVRTGIENLSDPEELAREKASQPAWMKSGFYVKLPMKDKHGRSAYFDLTYIIPFGDLAGGQLLERGVSRETGLPESVPSAILQKSPLLNLVKELSSNQDFYGDKIWKESDNTSKQLGDIMRHLTRLYTPPMIADQIPGGYMTSGERRIKGIRGTLSKEEEIKQQRTLMQELLRNAGIKIQPIDADIQETYMEWEKKKALENLLLEAGILKKFETSYVPKK